MLGVARQGRRECPYQADMDATEDVASRRPGPYRDMALGCVRSSRAVANLAHPMDVQKAGEWRHWLRSRRAVRRPRSSRSRVEYLGRKSALKLALREVRDRETGMTLNALRERLEAAIDAREGGARACPARPAPDGGADRRHVARHRGRAWAPPPHHADPPPGRGHLPRPGVHGRRRSRGRNARRTSTASTSPKATRHDRLSRRSSSTMRRYFARRRRPRRSERWRPNSRPSTSSRSAASIDGIPLTRPTRRPSTRSKGSSSTKASRSGTCSARSTIS